MQTVVDMLFTNTGNGNTYKFTFYNNLNITPIR
jgi:hypothetical protein